MAGILFEDGVTRWAGNSNSGGGHVVLYGPDGNPLSFKSDYDRGCQKIYVRQAGASALGTPIWALRNMTAGRVLNIRSIAWQLFFDGAGVATEMRYEFVKATGVTAMSGGTVIPALAKRTGISNADAECRVLDSGLTLTGASYGESFHTSVWARLTHSGTQAGGMSPQMTLNFGEQALELAQNEALVIRLSVVSVLGDTIAGSVDFCGG